MMNSQGIDVQMASQEGALAMAQAAQVAAAQAAGMGGAHNGGPPPHPGPPMKYVNYELVSSSFLIACFSV